MPAAVSAGFSKSQMTKAVGFTLAEIKEVVDAWYKKQITQKAQIDVLDKS